MKTFILKRTLDDGKQTLGTLQSSDGVFVRKTLERPWKNNQKNISCIPRGTYLCRWSFMWSHVKYHYQVMNVPGRSGIFIHSGNYFADVLGCILLGSAYSDINHDGEIDVINSTMTIKDFETLLSKQDFTLIVE